MIREITNELKALSNPEHAQAARWFFKTGKGQYGEGDEFIGVRVPAIRAVCKKYITTSLADTQKLVNSPIHEYRMTGLILLTLQYKKADVSGRQAIFEFYCDALERGRVNNWDLVDVSCGYIIGMHLCNKPRDYLYELARSESLWKRRSSIVSTMYFLQKGDDTETYRLAEILLNDQEDLIHKAVGWLLREAGKRVSRPHLTKFLDVYAASMPRTMLRYAIEHFDKPDRLSYLSKR